MCVWQSPWNARPRKSVAKVRVLDPISMSCPCTTWWITGLGLSGPAAVFSGIDIVTCRPDRTSAAAARTVSGVMKLSVPSSSSGPQRPQFLTASKISSNSRSVTGAGRVSSANMSLLSSRSSAHVLVVGVLGFHRFVHDRPDRADHRLRGLALEDVAAHVHAGRAAGDRVIGHGERVAFGKLFPA